MLAHSPSLPGPAGRIGDRAGFALLDKSLWVWGGGVSCVTVPLFR